MRGREAGAKGEGSGGKGGGKRGLGTSPPPPVHPHYTTVGHMTARAL